MRNKQMPFHFPRAWTQLNRCWNESTVVSASKEKKRMDREEI
jgi:hypothetical protein